MLQNTDWGLECKWDMRGNRREIFQQLKSDCPETWIFTLQSEIHKNQEWYRMCCCKPLF